MVRSPGGPRPPVAEGDDLEPDLVDYPRLDMHRVRGLMQTGIIVAPKRAPATKIVELMAKHHTKRIPILGDGTLVGIVGRADGIQARAGAALDGFGAGRA